MCERIDTAKVITWFHLSWFWFKKGRVCQKNSKRSPVSIPCQIFTERSERGMETQNERGDKLNKERQRHWITPHANNMNGHKKTDIFEKMSALQREKGERELEMDEWEGITSEWIFNSSKISHTKLKQIPFLHYLNHVLYVYFFYQDDS